MPSRDEHDLLPGRQGTNLESAIIVRGDEPGKVGRMTKRPGLSWPRRRLDEPCPETIIVMPFAINLCLALCFRKWLRRRMGRKAGTIIGNTVMVVFGGPPLLIAYVLVWGLRLVFAISEKLAARTGGRREGGQAASPS